MTYLPECIGIWYGASLGQRWFNVV